ncbi:MAG: AMP-binding protein [Ilumatobacter sp.]|nr:AMP-binding protein [Ilumatobacter sp.]
MGNPTDDGVMNVARMIEPHPADRVALISRNRETTYGQLRDQADRLRGGLAAAGVQSGDRVVVLCGNNRYFVVSYLAIVGLGAVVVPLNPASPAPEIERELVVVEPVAVVVGPAVMGTWARIDRSALPSLTTVIRAEGEPQGDERTIDEMLTSEPRGVVDVEGDHVAAMMFTSGTAGSPRAAMLSHRNLISNVEQDLTAIDHAREGDVVYGVLPLFHIFGLNVVLGVSLTVGATVLLVQRFDPATAVESFVHRGVTVVPGAPPMWIAFSHFDELPREAFGSVRLALSGAARLSPAVHARMVERFGVSINEGYGLTEASPVVTSSAGHEYRPGSVGRLLVGQEMRLIGDDGEEVPVGDAGEIWVRGENVFLGYYDDPAATERVLVDGWLRTGDIGMTDDAGYLYLVDRAKDLIIVSGFNVFPAEVEEVLQGHPAVREVGVLGVPHPHHGEAVKAFVVPHDGAQVDEDQLIDYSLDFLARYKCPTKVVFVDELPRNAAGKLVRRELEGTVLGA